MALFGPPIRLHKNWPYRPMSMASECGYPKYHCEEPYLSRNSKLKVSTSGTVNSVLERYPERDIVLCITVQVWNFSLFYEVINQSNDRWHSKKHSKRLQKVECIQHAPPPPEKNVSKCKCHCFGVLQKAGIESPLPTTACSG